MIRMQITFTDEAAQGGVGIQVDTMTTPPGMTVDEIPPMVGACFVGLATAINEYMREHGSPHFDCLKQKPRPEQMQ